MCIRDIGPGNRKTIGFYKADNVKERLEKEFYDKICDACDIHDDCVNITECVHRINYIISNTGNKKYTTIDVEQAVWFKNKALNVEEGTTVLLFSHRIPKSNFEKGEEPFIYNGRYTEPLLYTLQAKKRDGINIAAWFCGAYGHFEISNNGGINFISVKNHASSDVISNNSYDLGCDIITVAPKTRTLKIISSRGTDSTNIIY